MYMFCVILKTDEILSDVIRDIVLGPYEDVLTFRSVMGSYSRHVNVIHLPPPTKSMASLSFRLYEAHTQHRYVHISYKNLHQNGTVVMEM